MQERERPSQDACVSPQAVRLARFGVVSPGATEAALLRGRPRARLTGGAHGRIARGERLTRDLPRRGSLAQAICDRLPRLGGIARAIGPDRPLRRYSCSSLMTTNQTTDAFDTAELELVLAAEAPADEVEQDQPTWTPDDGDFN
jgi:hypothetical protein